MLYLASGVYIRENGDDTGFSYIEFMWEAIGTRIALTNVTQGRTGVMTDTLLPFTPTDITGSRIRVLFVDCRKMLEEILEVLGRGALILEAFTYLHNILMDMAGQIEFEFMFVLIIEHSLVDQNIALALARISNQLLASTGKCATYLHIRAGADTDEVNGEILDAMMWTDTIYQGRSQKASTYLITNGIKSFCFRDGTHVPKEWLPAAIQKHTT